MRCAHSRDFLDIFPKVLPWLPPEKEIDFAIDLVPGIVPNGTHKVQGIKGLIASIDG